MNSFFQKCYIKKIILSVFFITMLISDAMAIEVPTSSETANINGKQILTEVYNVPSEVNPEDLIKSDFSSQSFVYTFESITKDETKTESVKNIEQEVSIPVESKNLNDNLSLLNAYINYTDEEGYQGNLYLLPDTVKIVIDGYASKNSIISDTKTYTGLEYNDPTLIPQTVQKNGYTLSISSIDWNEEGMVQDGTIPATFSATATYTKSVSSSYATGYTMTAKYKGDVSKTSIENIKYTINYLGTEIESEITVSNNGFFGNMSNNQVIIVSVLFSIALIIIIAIIIIIIKNRKGKTRLPK